MFADLLLICFVLSEAQSFTRKFGFSLCHTNERLGPEGTHVSLGEDFRIPVWAMSLVECDRANGQDPVKSS